MRARRILAALLVLGAVPLAAVAGERGPVRSFLELRRDRVVRQAWDLSCGAAALSTVLTYDIGDPVPEKDIVQTILQGADAARIQARGGFSLLDLKRYATARGHAAEGYGNLDLDGLAKLGVAIVPTLSPAGPHFMVFRGLVDGRVLVADPAYGNRTFPYDRFLAMWSPRVAFVVRPRGSALPPGDDTTLATLVPARVIRGALGVHP